MSDRSARQILPKPGDADPPDEPAHVAIVGMSGRFPGARNIDEFWSNLIAGKESIAFFSAEELEQPGFDPDVLANPDYVRAKGVLEDVQLFDASFFAYSPLEAETIDPQHRFFLECAWSALEDAGIDPHRYQGAVGVYAGTGFNTYLLLNLLGNPEAAALLGGYQISIGNDKDHLATRVSYKLNLRGPSMTVQTTCSTSLVAACLATQSLLDFQCDVALAGGVSIKLPEKAGYLYQQGGIASPDGHCRVFDAEAKGTVGGDGVGVVVLKRLEDALVDGDNIYAVIRGAAINNDGAAKVGYTAPSVEGQAEVIAMAQAMAEVNPETITYIEAHGTGTPLGDPIEIAALTQVFRRKTGRRGFCGIGSVKSNIGHLDAAAGVAGLIKTALALKRKVLPPSLHFKSANPQIDFATSPFYVCQRAEPWVEGATPRRAGVSAFGIGGTNAHLVLEEAPPVRMASPSRSPSLLLLSAQTASALDAIQSNLALFLRNHPELEIGDVAYTLQTGRRAWAHRLAVLAGSREDAIQRLTTASARQSSHAMTGSERRPIFFMFPGQGSQYANMARGIYETESVFRQIVDTGAKLLKPELGLDLRTIIFSDDSGSSAGALEIDRTWLTQPALFLTEYALATLWVSWGIRPTAMVGHSIGEYVAACLGEVFEFRDALSLVALRGRLMQSLPEGAMLSVALSPRDIVPLLGKGLSLAAVNSPDLCVVSGDPERVEQCRHELAARGITTQPLRTSHAFHSHLMDSVVAPFREAVEKTPRRPSRIPYLSNVTGTWATASENVDPAYWARHLRQTVRFSDAVQELLKDTGSIFLEVGPGNTLCSLVRQQGASRPDTVLVASCRPRHDVRADMVVLSAGLAALWSAGVDVDWSKFYISERRHRLSLPTYPFERKQFWIAPRADRSSGEIPASLGRKRPVAHWISVPSWRRAPPWRQPAHEVSQGDSVWLFFLDGTGLAEQCRIRLEQRSQDVVTVMVGAKFEKLSPSTYAIRPEDPADYLAVVRDLYEHRKKIRFIVHCWAVGQLGLESRDVVFFSLLYLAQALGRGVSDPITITVASTGLHDVLGDESVSAKKALLLGPCRVIPQEYPNIECRSVDLSLADSHPWRAKTVDAFVAECERGAVGCDVAYRRDHRWVRTFDPIRPPADASTSPFRKEGVYLITGGLGGIGFAVAEYLAATFNARLILLGRSVGVDQVGVHASDAETISAKLARLQALGGDVLAIRADVTNKAQMAAVASRAQQRFGRINGVLHAAGVPGQGIIQLKHPTDIKRILSPKIEGTMVLASAFNLAELDFFLLFSSLSSLLGGPGQVDYAAANAFLDAFAHAISKKGVRVLSINWDRWAEVGMAVNEINRGRPGERDRDRSKWLAHGIRTKDGIEALSLALTIATPQVAVSPQDLALITSDGRPKPLALDPALVFPAVDRHPRPDHLGEYVAPTDDVQAKIAEHFQALLGIEQVSIDDNFFDLGGHSLSGTQLTARLQQLFDVEMSVDLLFKAQSPRALAVAISQLLQTVGSDGELAPIEKGTGAPAQANT
jgi:acyl transferase domain-containing protein/acyl carrier protein